MWCKIVTGTLQCNTQPIDIVQYESIRTQNYLKPKACMSDINRQHANYKDRHLSNILFSEVDALLQSGEEGEEAI